MSAEIKRRGARRMADVTPQTIAGLNAGVLETATIVESYVIDFVALMTAIEPSLAGAAKARLVPEAGVTRRMAAAGELLFETFGSSAFDRARGHASDTVRGWAAYSLACEPDLTIAERLTRVRPLADDPHFGVREWAWIALRRHVAAALDEAIATLEPWVVDDVPNIRRYAVEITRPRGVWCAHIGALKDNPAKGEPLLEPVRADTHRYIQDSVANWLNDASKTQPEWVNGVCARWRAESGSPATRYIVRRALRSLSMTARRPS